MSSSIDERIVEMRFENDQFERGVKETSHSLEEFKKKLNLEGATKGFQEIENATKNIKLSGISAAVDEINHKFSLMGVAAATAVQNMTNKMVNAFTGMVNSVTVAPITAGFSKYEEKLKSTQVILNSITDETKKNMDYVGSQLDRIALFTDETSYSFTDMVNNIGKFTASNVDLETAVTAMQGISTWAARAGASVTEAGRAMYNLSQSIGMGYVATMDWKSIENANMATAEFKRIALEAAAEMGTLTKVAEDMYETLDGKEQVSVENFRNTLQRKWFTSDVLIKSLDDYGKFANLLMQRIEEYDYAFDASKMLKWIDEYRSGELDMNAVMKSTKLDAETLNALFAELGDETLDFSRAAFQAAQEARTFGDAIAATVDAVSTKWMTLFEYLFGNYEQAKKLWTDLSIALWDIFAGPLDKLNDVLGDWADNGGQAEFLRGIYALGRSVYNIIMSVRKAFSSIFPPATAEALKAGTKIFADFAETIEKATEYVADFVLDVVDDAKEEVKEVSEVIETVTGAAEAATGTLEEFADSVLQGLYGNGVDRRKALESLGVSYEAVQNKVNELLGSTYRYTDEQGNVITALKRVSDANDQASNSFKDTAKAMEEVDSDSVSEELNDTGDSAERLETMGQKLHDTLVGVFSIVRIFSEALGALNKHIIMPLVRFLVPRIIDGILSITSYIGRLSFDFMKLIHDTQLFDKVFGGIADVFKNIGKGFSDFINQIKESEAFKTTVEYFEQFVEFLSGVGSDIFEGFKGLFESFTNMGKDGTIVSKFVKYFEFLNRQFNNLLQFISPVTNALGQLISGITKAFAKLDFSGLDPVFNTIGKGLEYVAGGFGLIFDYVSKNAYNVKSLLSNTFSMDFIKKWFETFRNNPIIENFNAFIVLLTEFFTDLSKSFEEAKKKTDGVDAILAPFIKIRDTLGSFFAPITKVMQPFIKSVNDMFNSFIKGLSNFNMSTFLNNLQSGVTIAAIAALALAIKNASKIFKGVAYMFESIGDAFDAFKKRMQASTILTIAVAIAALAGSLYLLSKADKEGLREATGCLLLLAFAMGAMMVILQDVAKAGGGKDFAFGAGALIAMAGAFLMLAGSLSLLSDMPWGKFGKSLIQVAIIAGLMITIIAILTKIGGGPSNWREALGAIGGMYAIYYFAMSIKKVVEALVDLSEADLSKVKEKMPYLIGIMIMLGAVALAAGNLKFGGSIGFIGIVAGIYLWVKLLQKLSEVNYKELYKTLGKLSGLLIALVAMSKLANATTVSGLGALFLGLGVAIIAIAAAMKILSTIQPDRLWPAVGAIEALLAGLAVIIWVSKGFEGKGIWQLTAVFIGLSVALVAATICIAALTLIAKYEPKALEQAFWIIEVILVTLGGLAGLASKAQAGLGGLASLILLLVAVAGSLYALAILTKSSDLLNIAGSMLMILGGLALVFVAIESMGKTHKFGEMLVIIAEMALLLGAISAVFIAAVNYLDKDKIDNVIQIATALAIALGTITAVTYAAQFIDAGAAAYGALGLDAVVLLIVALAAVLGAFSKLEEEYKVDIIERGLDMLVKIGDAIGKFIGKLIGGIFGGGLESISEGLSAFAENIKPFMEFVSTMSDDTEGKVKSFTEIIKALAGINFKQLSTDMDGEAFKNTMRDLANGLKSFYNGIADVEDWSVATKVANVVKTLSETKLDGITISGLQRFSAGLPQFGTTLTEFATNVDNLTYRNLTSVDIATQMTQKLASLKLPNDGGLFGAIVGDNSWEDFGKGLADYGDALVNFSEASAKLTPEYQASIDVALAISEKLAELEGKIPNSGGLAAELLGDNTWTKLGEGLVQYALALNRFGAACLYLAQYIEPVDSAVIISEKLAELQSKFTNTGGFLQDLIGDKDWTTLKTGLEDFGHALAGFCYAVLGVKMSYVSGAFEMLEKLIAISNQKLDGTNLEEFGRNLLLFGNFLKGFSDLVSPEEIAANFSAFATGLTDLATSMTNDVLHALTNNSTDFRNAGEASMTQYVNGLQSGANSAKNAATDIAKGVLNGLESIAEASITNVANIQGNAYVTALKNFIDDAHSIAQTIAENVKTGLESYNGTFYDIGVNAAQGFINGMESKISEAAATAAEMAKAAKEAAKFTLDEESPSKEMMKIGSFAGEGFVIGLMNWVGKASAAATTLADSTKNTINDSVSDIVSIINDEMSDEFIITPTLNLSQITSGARMLNSMINSAGVNITEDEAAKVNQNGVSNGMTFVQNNYSPKALSQIEIYRQTKNQFAMAKGLVNGR